MEFLREQSLNLLFRCKSLAAQGAPAAPLCVLGRQLPAAAGEELRCAVEGLAWFTYTRGFAPIELADGRRLESDTGWGCMVRCGQMVLFAALARVHGEEDRARLLQTFFAEAGAELGAFALQRLVDSARVRLGKPPGEWFRATTFALALEGCLEAVRPAPGFTLLNVVENVLCWEEFALRAFTAPRGYADAEDCLARLRGEDWERRVLLSVHMMLGVERLDPRYEPVLQALCRLESFVGFLGGEGGKAFFFYGLGGGEYLYLDPHLCRRALGPAPPAEIERAFFGPKPVFSLPAARLSSSVTVWLLLEDRRHFAQFLEAYRALAVAMGEEFFFWDGLRRPEEGDEGEIVAF